MSLRLIERLRLVHGNRALHKTAVVNLGLAKLA